MNCVSWGRMATFREGRQAALRDLWDCGRKGLMGYTWDKRGQKWSEERGNEVVWGNTGHLGTVCGSGRLRSRKPANFTIRSGKEMNPIIDKLNTAIAHCAHWNWDFWVVLMGVFGKFSSCFKTQLIPDPKNICNWAYWVLRIRSRLFRKLRTKPKLLQYFESIWENEPLEQKWAIKMYMINTCKVCYAGTALYLAYLISGIHISALHKYGREATLMSDRKAENFNIASCYSNIAERTGTT